MKRQKGNVDEFTRAYMEYYPLILSATLTKVSNSDDARDICQEVFAIFYDKFDTIENKRAWLYGALKNVVYRYYNKKDTSVDIDEVFDDIGLSFTNGFRDTRILIREAMDNNDVTEEERVILDLIATRSFSYENVARILGLTRRQVEYKYSQVVKGILDYLKKKGIKDIAELL